MLDTQRQLLPKSIYYTYIQVSFIIELLALLKWETTSTMPNITPDTHVSIEHCYLHKIYIMFIAEPPRTDSSKVQCLRELYSNYWLKSIH